MEEKNLAKKGVHATSRQSVAVAFPRQTRNSTSKPFFARFELMCVVVVRPGTGRFLRALLNTL